MSSSEVKTEMTKESPKPTIQERVIQGLVRQLIDSGIPVTKAVFQSNVNNSDNVPESTFNEDSQNKSRRVQMWWTPQGLLCKQKDQFFLVPPANIIFVNFK
jgi:hypothetical protein